MKQRTDAEATHRQAWETIPWLINGTADEAARRMVESHARGCEDCRTELARQRELQAAMAQASNPLTDPDRGLQQLFRRIDRAASDASPAAAPVRARRTGAGALVYGLTFAVVVEAIGLSVLGVGLLSRTTPAAPDYRTLSDAPLRGIGVTIRVVPAPGMSLGELQGLLRDLDLQVVAGPNQAGAYALAPLSARQALDDRVARLRAAPGMRLVEPVPPREAAP